MLGMTDFSTIPSYFIDNASLLHGTSSVNETGGGLGGLVKLIHELRTKTEFTPAGSYTIIGYILVGIRPVSYTHLFPRLSPVLISMLQPRISACLLM